MSTFTYLRSFFTDKDVASITPTSKKCVEHVCRSIDFSKNITIVEYGAGAGVFADYLLRQMTPESTLIMFETNRRLFKKLKEIQDSRVVLFNKSVELVDELLDKSRKGRVDYIISGIPFSFMGEPVQQTILRKTKIILKPGGVFLAYQTSNRLKTSLYEIFGNVYTEWEWKNLPPLIVYRAAKDVEVELLYEPS